MEGTDGTRQALREQSGDGPVVPLEQMEVVSDPSDRLHQGERLEGQRQCASEREGRPLRIVVCGATGYLGKFVCKIAKERGYYVRWALLSTISPLPPYCRTGMA